MHSDGTRWTFTRRFAAKQGQSRFLGRLNEARNFFPELEEETIKVGITVNVPGKADPKNKGVYFRSRNVSYYVMGHELTHLLQGMGRVPSGERSCDLYTLAREVEFCDESPNYIKVPKRLLDGDGFIRREFRGMVHETAKTAINLKAQGKRRYIAWFEKTLEDICMVEEMTIDEPTQTRKDGPDSSSQAKLEDYFGVTFAGMNNAALKSKGRRGT
ncbi:MAG: hypothetical protein JSW28_02785 [Thermoplasmata archaeon]|nr:MAG: hypothetical protein JSW28_02785 [Thermoplasmata archaeon]